MIYVDSSIVLSVILEEENHDTYWKWMKRNQALLVSSNLLTAEVLSVCAREKIDEDYALKLLGPIKIISLQQSIYPELKKIFACAYLRGADAYHVAAALYFEGLSGDKVKFISTDKTQVKVARQLGFTTDFEGRIT